MRRITLTDKKIFDLLEKKRLAIEEGKAQYKVVEQEQAKLNKCGLKIQQIKDKVVPLVEKYDFDLGEFEYVSSVENVKGETIVTITDAVEEYKKAYAAQRKNKNNDTTGKANTNAGDTKK